jgi:glycosyltransferase involved in cell wall biosynthesis
MRIAVATRTLARIGGVEAYVEYSVGGLRDAGHDVCVFPEDRQARPGNGSTVHAWTPASGAPRSLPWAVRAYAPDVVITHGLLDPAMDEALAAIRPSVFFAHAYHGTCISGAKAHSFPGVRPCEQTLGPGCLLRYYPRRCGGLNPVTMAREYRVQRRRLAAVQRHDRLFAISAHVIDEYARHGLLRARMRVLPPPVPTAGTPESDSIDRDHVVYVGRLERLKGPAVAVAAVAAAAVRLARPLRLTIAGDGSGVADVHRALALAPPGALRDVCLAGRLDRDACAVLLAGAGLLVTPSLWPEPFGLVGFEAAAHGVPAVAFRVGGIPEWLTDGLTGHLAAPHSDPVAALCDAIVLALGDDAHYRRLRQGARAAHAAAAARDHIGALAQALDDLVRGEAQP